MTTLNIRRYVDTTPPPEPQDVRAHLHGGVPKVEVVSSDRYDSGAGARHIHVWHPEWGHYSEADRTISVPSPGRA
jgi:type I restriction enzyme M protein